MHSGSQKFDTAPVCKSGDNIVYAWAMDAPELRLPPGVGFKVGGDTDIQWLVLQVHYKDVSSFLPPSRSLLRHSHVIWIKRTARMSQSKLKVCLKSHLFRVAETVAHLRLRL